MTNGNCFELCDLLIDKSFCSINSRKNDYKQEIFIVEK